ncbi:MAG: hypothetical protein AB1442_03155 [Nitrospirota bacterium]
MHIVASFLLSAIFSLGTALGWHDETHLSVAKAAGYKKWYNAVGADITKIKADRIERNNHYFDNLRKVEVTPDMVLGQVKRYNDPKDTEGHLYGAIIASLREYKSTTEAGKYAAYHLAFCAHYVADLSQPLHNCPYDIFNETHHKTNDGIVEDEVFENISKIKENMYSVILRKEYFEKDLAREIARIANISRKLGYKLQKENRDMTKEEAYRQLGHSASLLKAILKHAEGIEK